jgi:hypothetical protein
MITRIADEEVEFDAEATRSCYLQLPIGVGCDCVPCRNFEALGEQAFPPGAHQLFERLGIDYQKPAEVSTSPRITRPD